MGRVVGLFGVQGWLKVYAYTQPKENLLRYSEWRLEDPGGAGSLVLTLEDGKRQGKGLLAKLQGVDDRDQARRWLGSTIRIARDALPKLPDGEYYWVDLQGLRVRTQAGVELGVVDHLIETGAHDVLVVHGERERLIPFVLGHSVVRVDQEAGVIEVDWDPDF